MTAAIKELPLFGVEVDRDLRTDKYDDEVAELFKKYGFLLFRNQQLTSEQQRRVMSRLGPVLDDFKTVGYVSNTRPDGILGDIDVSFHSDWIYTEEPALGISLHAIEVPYEETWTSFASGVRALAKLPKALRERIANLKGLNLFSATAEGVQGRQSLEGYPEDAPRCWHKVVRVDPVTEQEALYITQQNTVLLDGVGPEESEEIIKELHDYLYSPDNIYQHRWRNGDLVIWANQAFHHARGGLVPGKTRTLQRVCITNATSKMYDAPYPAERMPPSMRQAR